MSSVQDYAEAYATLAKKANEKTADIDEKLAELQAERLRIRTPYEEKLQHLLRRMKQLIDNEDNPASVDTPYGAVRYRNGYIRTSWDSKGLDSLETGKPAVWKVIKAFRKETEVDSGASFEVKK